ncbi:alpha/beta fold hydrolase [Salinirubellus sp. GCM10025818]|uniref:alpha/beta fold hydrolase n=1 Tax=Salinirubellus TaxID=2162630 RepID=UPI0030D29DD1
MSPEMSTIEANGLAFECLEVGDGDRLALCLHGFPDDAGSMAPIQSRLAEAGYTAVAPYMRGYEPTGPAPDDDYSARALGADAVALAEAYAERDGFEEAVLVGHDWGAVAGYAAAVRSPGTFDRMATLAVPPRFDALLARHPRQIARSWYVWLFQVPDVAERAVRWQDFALLESLWGLWSPSWDYPGERIESVKTTFSEDETVENALAYYRQFVGPAVRRIVGSGRLPSFDERRRIEVPTLVLAGNEDGAIGPELFDRADQAFDARCRVVRVNGAGHFLHQERPDVVGEEVVAFLTGREGR